MIRFGCRKIAEQISSAFGIAIKKDVGASSSNTTDPYQTVMGPSWLTVIAHAKESL